MRIIIVRHGDPNYELDTLTPTGWKEAAALVPRIHDLNEQCGGFKQIYVSPLGRAQDTASLSLKALGREAIVCDWLQEFPGRIMRPDVQEHPSICWDWLPKDWTNQEQFYLADEWYKHPVMQAGNVEQEYFKVANGIDAILKENGYVRTDASNGYYYDVKKANNDTIVIFAHFGLECVLISHLIHCSPMLLWHNFCAAPTSVTTIISEERRPGVASFRVSGFGDVSHLYANQMTPSFSARFCECYTNETERHD